MKVENRKKKRPLFDPDAIATSIAEGILDDTRHIEQQYGVFTPAIRESVAIQSRDILKKYIPKDCSTENLRNDAFEKFKDVNRHMLDHNIRFIEMLPTFRDKQFHGSVIQREDLRRTKVLLRARYVMRETLGDWGIEELYLAAKHSQGSSVGVPFIDTSLEKKFSFPLSTTTQVGPLFEDYLTFDTELKVELDERLSKLREAEPTLQRYAVVEGSSATTVRKTALKDRMIAVEPTLNMFFQQGLMAMLYQRMRAVGLNVEFLPEKHRWLARIHSISGNSATIDWSSASDCVSIELLRWLLPPKWFDIVYLLRSPKMKIGGEYLEPQMISTMGNAVTFPLETLVFWAVGVALQYTLKHTDNRLFIPIRGAQISVFGDDCIVPSWMAPQYIETLTDLGFIVNDEKSFYGDERFRESCGGDYSAGYNVRPFCLKAPTSRKMSALEPWLYISMNALIPRYISYFGALSWLHNRKLFAYFESVFVKHNLELKVVPNEFPDDAGLKVGFDLERFLVYYPGFRLRISKIVKDRHGRTYFNYLRFKYHKEATPVSEVLRYLVWLKDRASVLAEDDVKLPWHKHLPLQRHEVSLKTMFNPERKGGGYVVAKEKEYAHWVIADFKNVDRYGIL